MTLDVSGCLNRYEAHGIRFDYPDIWELSEEIQPNGDVEITVSTVGTAFWTLRLFSECPSPQEVMDSCVAAFRDEYEGLDDYPASMTLAEMPAQTRELEFSCLELLNTALISCVRTMQFTLLIWWQSTDHELAEIRNTLDDLTASVRILALQD